MTANMTSYVFDYTQNLTTVSHTDKIIAASLYLILAIFGISLHILVFIGVLKMHENKIFKLPPFYILMSNLYLADIFKLSLYLFYASPSILANRSLYGDWIGFIFSYGEGVDYSCVVLSTLILSLNRAITLENKQLAEKIFNPRLCVFYSILAWLIGFVGKIIDHYVFNCQHGFSVDHLSFSLSCRPWPKFDTVSSFITDASAYGVAIFYLRALYVLNKQRLQIHVSQFEQKARKYQIRLFLQALFVWLGLVGNMLTFKVIGRSITGLSWALVITFLVLGQCYITPLCMLIFVKIVRRHTWNLIRGKQQSMTASTVIGNGQRMVDLQ